MNEQDREWIRKIEKETRALSPRVEALEEGLSEAFNHVFALNERVAALESGWATLGEAAREATERLKRMMNDEV